jgi:hypothetical protein
MLNDKSLVQNWLGVVGACRPRGVPHRDPGKDKPIHWHVDLF